MKFRDLLRLSTSNLFKRKLRTVLTVLGVTIGVASIVVMVSLGLGLSRSLNEEMSNFGSLTSVDVRDASNGGYYMPEEDNQNKDENKHLDDNAIEELKALDHVIDVIPVLTINIMLKSGGYECSYVELSGVPEGYLESQGIKLAKGNFPKENGGMPKILYGNMVQSQFYNPKTQSGYWYNGEMADIDYMKDPMTFILDQDAYWQYQYGSSESGTVPQMPKKHLFETAGVIAGGPEDYNSYGYSLYCNIDDLKTVLKRDFKNKPIPGQPTTPSGKPYKEIFYSQLIVMTDSMDHVTDLQSQINGMGYMANSDAEWIAQEQKTMSYIQLVLGGIGAVSLLVAAIGIANTMMMSIYERTKEIGIMKVLGCDMRNIQGMFLIEAGFIGFIGGITGLVISYGLSVLVNFAAKNFAGDMGITGNISYIPLWLAILSLGFAILVGMIAGFFPSLRAMRLSPLAAIKNE